MILSAAALVLFDGDAFHPARLTQRWIIIHEKMSSIELEVALPSFAWPGSLSLVLNVQRLQRLYLQLLGVVLSFTSVPIFVPNELSISEILCHSSFSSKGDKMARFWVWVSRLPVECLLLWQFPPCSTADVDYGRDQKSLSIACNLDG